MSNVKQSNQSVLIHKCTGCSNSSDKVFFLFNNLCKRCRKQKAKDDKNPECLICYNHTTNIMILGCCKKVICKPCINKIHNHNKTSGCPYCRVITKTFPKSSECVCESESESENDEGVDFDEGVDLETDDMLKYFIRIFVNMEYMFRCRIKPYETLESNINVEERLDYLIQEYNKVNIMGMWDNAIGILKNIKILLGPWFRRGSVFNLVINF